MVYECTPEELKSLHCIDSVPWFRHRPSFFSNMAVSFRLCILKIMMMADISCRSEMSEPYYLWSSRLEGLHDTIVPGTCYRSCQCSVFGSSHWLEKLWIKRILVVMKCERLHCLFFSGRTHMKWIGILCNNKWCLGECLGWNGLYHKYCYKWVMLYGFDFSLSHPVDNYSLEW